MARTVRNANLESRAARQRLPVQRKPFWMTLVPKALHLGYRKRRANAPGVWTARRYVGRGKYAEATLGIADDYQDADGARVLSYAQAQAVAQDAAPLSTCTVADAMEIYVRDLEARGKRGGDAAARAANHILPELGHIKLSDLTTGMLNRWRDSLVATNGLLANGAQRQAADRRARRATANRTLVVLRAALNVAFRDGHVGDDVAWRRVESFEKVHAPRQRFLTVEECQRLLNACTPEFRSIVHAALLTGARWSELCALHCKDYGAGKVHVATSKSGKSRDIVLTEEGQELFRQLTVGRAAGEHIFRRANGRPYSHSQQAVPMARACAAANIVPAVSFHILRHTYASLAVMAGMPLTVVARQLGHADTQMVEKHYGHLAGSFIDEQVRQHAPRFAPVQPTNVRPMQGRG
jgi:integrase